MIGGATALVGLASAVVVLATNWDDHEKAAKLVPPSPTVSVSVPAVPVATVSTPAPAPSTPLRTRTTPAALPPSDAQLARLALMSVGDIGSPWIAAGPFQFVQTACEGTEPFLAFASYTFTAINDQDVHLTLDESIRSYSNAAAAEVAINQDRSVTSQECLSAATIGTLGEVNASSQEPPTACAGGNFLSDSMYINGELSGYDNEVQCGRWVVEAATYSKDIGFHATPTSALQLVNDAARKAAARLT
jgi:hypothetical protein